MIARAAGCVLLVALLFGCAQSPEPVVLTDGLVQASTIEVGGVERVYFVHEPAAVAADALLPVLIVFHGAGGDAIRAEHTTGFTADANDDGFLVVYPNGTQATEVAGELSWNAGACCGLAKNNAVDDVAFVRAMVEQLELDYLVDSARIYLTGFSNGGMLSYRLVCEASDLFAGIAVVGGALNYADCSPSNPVSVLIVHGTTDATVPYLGGPTNDRTASRFGQWQNTSVDFARAFWTGNDGCEADPISVTEEKLTTESYLGCALDSRVEVATIDGGTHTWPRTESSGVDASALVLNFFDLSR